MNSEAEPIREKKMPVVRIVIARLLTVVMALAFAFAVYVMTQVPLATILLGALLVLLPLAALQYLVFLLLHPPQAASEVRVAVGWFLMVAIALAFASAVCIMTQASPGARIVAVFLVLLPLAVLQYLAFLVLHPPPVSVWASIRG